MAEEEASLLRLSEDGYQKIVKFFNDQWRMWKLKSVKPEKVEWTGPTLKRKV